ncbi:MAG: HlyC/CorC family transporter [Bacilli bacterium]|nr:HlyC/CorC family transporter [Bacilli bacterium]
MYWYYWVIVAICCLFSGFFSCADMVYGIVDKDRLEKENTKLSLKALKIANDYELSISAILFGNNIVNVLASSLVAFVGMLLYDDPTLWNTISTIVLTVTIIIFCEFLPKVIAKRFPYPLSKGFAWPVTIAKYLLFVFVWPISLLFKLLALPFRKKAVEEEEIDEDVLTEMVDTMEEEEVLEEGEAELVRSAISFNDIEAHEIMTPRVDVFAIDIADNIQTIISDEEFFVHSRIPVYEDSIDNIIGILPVKKLAKLVFSGEENIDIRKLLYKPIVIPRNRQIIDLLREFKESKVHIAVIIDEYGGTEGIVTMEDILEEIVGDIFDETDEASEEFIDNGDGTYVVEGSMNIDDCFELINFNDDELETDYSTIGGFCQQILDRFAKTGDEFDFDRFHFIILEATDYTVERLKIIDTKFGIEEE